MANVVEAIRYVLSFEDGNLSGIITHTADGKRTRFGIDEHFHPELTNCLFYSTMGSTAALHVATSVYEKQYADPLCIEQITSQEVGNKLLSLGANIGVATAAKMLQDALKVPGDGRIGPISLEALDNANPEEVLDQLKEAAEAHYDNLIRENPSLAIYRAGWLRRAEA